MFSVLFFLIVPAFDAVGLLGFNSIPISDELTDQISNISGLSSTYFSGDIQSQTNSNSDFGTMILVFYASVSFTLLARFLYHLTYLLREKFVVSKEIHKGYNLALVNIPVNPFSFLRTTYIQKEVFLNGQIDEELLLHEKGHTSQLHSIDVIFIQLVQVFFWFNPFIHLFKRSIQINHEYLADDYVINSGHSRIDYSMKLLHYSTRFKSLGLASEFSYMLIKNRLIMLSKKEPEKKSHFQLMIVFFVIATTMLFFITACTSINEGQRKGQFYADNILWSESNGKLYMKGKVSIDHGSNVGDGQGTFSFYGKVSLLIVDGNEMKYDSELNVSGKRCDIVSLDPKEAVRKYGDRGKHGAIEISTL